MNLRLKMLLAFLGVTFSIVSLGYLGLSNLSRARRAEADLRQINSQRLLLHRFGSDLEAALVLAVRLRSEPEARHRERFESDSLDALRSLDDLKNSGLNKEIQEKVFALRGELVDFRNAVRRTAAGPQGPKGEGSGLAADLELRALGIRERRQALNDLFDRQFFSANVATSRRLRLAYVWFLAAVFLAVVLSVGFGFFLYHALLGPLGELREAAEQIRAGNLAFELDPSGDEEFSAVKRAFVEMSRALEREFGEQRRLREELDQANRRLEGEKRDFERLVEIGNAASSSLELTQVLKILATRAGDMVPCLRCSVFRIDEDDPGKAHLLSSTLHHKGAPVAIDMDRYPEIRAAAMRRAIVQIDDVSTDPLMRDAREAATKAGISSVLAVAMLHQGRFQGVLSLVRSEARPEAFSPWERRLAETIASIGAVCMENAQFFSSVQASRDRVEALNATLRNSLDDLRTTRDRLVASERMAALGEMAASVAHSLRNPLAAIRATAQASLADGNGHGPLRDIVHLVDRMGRHLNQILDFSRSGTEIRTSVDPNQAVRNVVDLLSSRASERGVSLVANLADGIPSLVANPERFERAILAVLENAIEASRPEGRVEIRTLGDRGEGLRIEVEDRGDGIPAEVLPRVFEPFFSTKTNGTGLGTTIARKVIQSLSGTIELSSEAGAGTLVVMRIPGLPS